MISYFDNEMEYDAEPPGLGSRRHSPAAASPSRAEGTTTLAASRGGPGTATMATSIGRRESSGSTKGPKR